MKIAVLDDYANLVRTLDCFSKLAGHDVLVLDESLDEDTLAARLADREALVPIRERSSIPRSLIDRLPDLRLISQTLAWGREGSATRAAADGVPMTGSRRERFERSDLLCVHLRLGSDTRGLIGVADFAVMKPGAVFVNTARAGLIVPGALLAGLDAHRPERAALDI